MDTSYQRKTQPKVKLLQATAESHRSRRRNEGHWRTQSACEGHNTTEFTIDPVSEVRRAEEEKKISGIDAYHQFREKLRNKLQDKLNFCDQLQSVVMRAQ